MGSIDKPVEISFDLALGLAHCLDDILVVDTQRQ